MLIHSEAACGTGGAVHFRETPCGGGIALGRGDIARVRPGIAHGSVNVCIQICLPKLDYKMPGYQHQDMVSQM